MPLTVQPSIHIKMLFTTVSGLNHSKLIHINSFLIQTCHGPKNIFLFQNQIVHYFKDELPPSC